MVILFTMSGLVLHKGTASAAGCSPPVPLPANYLPQACNFDQGNRVSLITAIYGNGYVLDSPTSTVRMYSPNRNNQLTITNGGNCPGTGGDVGPDNSQALTTFFVYALPPTNYNTANNTPYGSPLTLIKSVTNKTIGCQSTYTFSIDIPGTIPPLGGGSQEGQFGYEISAVMSSSTPGWNQFKLQVSAGNGRLSYYAGSGDHFALKATDNGGGVPGDPGNFYLGFAPGCGYTGNSGVLKWFDADAGQANQNFQSPVRTQLVEYDKNGNQTGTQTIDITTGNNQGGSQTVTIRPQHKYMWVWNNIYSSNGIQFQLPFDSWNTLLNYDTDCQQPNSVACSISPASQTVAQNKTGTINISATSTQAWKSTYYIKRTGPSYRNITNGTPDGTGKGASFTDSVVYTGTNSVSYIYVVWDSATDNQVSAKSCSQDITWVPGGQIYCTAKPADPNPDVNNGDTITVTLFNNSTQNLQGGQLRQTSPGGGAWPLSGFGNFSQGQQASHDYVINARTSPQTVTFEYTLFTGTNAGDPVFPGTGTPLCTTTITWKQAGVPTVTASCSQVNVTAGISSATYQPLAYIKNHTNINLASAHAKSGGQVAVFIDPGGGGGGGGTLPPPPATITKIPIKLEITGNGIDQIVYGWVGNTSTGNGTQYQQGTFNTFSQAWPHLTGGYTITLSYVPSGASQANVDDGNFYADEVWAVANSTQINGGQSCLDAFCGQYSSVDSEPGQRQSYSYGIHVNNPTDKTFSASDGNGYSFGVNVGGGLHDVNYEGPSNDISPGTPTNININFDARVDWLGSFGITMYFKGSPLLTLEGIPGGGCGDASAGQTGPPGAAPANSRPFFEVRGTDARTGGGYKSSIGSCGSAGDPPYVSPTSAKKDIEGGIRSFAFNLGGTIYGSRGEFGADVLGVIFQGQNYGFYAGATFANQDQPSNSMGGFLNSDNGGIYTAHCLDDYYTNTRLTQTPTGFGGGNIGAQASGQYQASSSISLSGTNVPHGKQITLYVNGDVTITGNITYDNIWDATNQKDVPFLAIIARGNIYVAPGVTTLDGLYISQPDTSSGGGIFNTCTPGDFCNQQLVVNGAVIAQGVQLLRAHGTVGPLEQDQNNLTTNPAEVFNFVPSMVMGLPYWQNVDRGGAVVPNDIEALFSLPPVF